MRAPPHRTYGQLRRTQRMQARLTLYAMRKESAKLRVNNTLQKKSRIELLRSSMREAEGMVKITFSSGSTPNIFT